jgi:hypothetical protein
VRSIVQDAPQLVDPRVRKVWALQLTCWNLNVRNIRAHSVSVTWSSHLSLFVLTAMRKTCLHCVGRMQTDSLMFKQVVRIVTAVLYTLETTVTKSGNGSSASGVSVLRQRDSSLKCSGKHVFSFHCKFWHIATCGRWNVSQPSAN